MLKKIGIVGGGNVGTETARYLAYHDVADVVLLDIVENMPMGKALDLNQAAVVNGFSARVTGTNDYGDLRGCEVVVITAGKPRKPGMSREELLKVNFDIVSDVAEKVMRAAPEAVYIVVSNPLDAMVYTVARVTKAPRERVFGMAGLLDVSRLSAFVAAEMGVSAADVQAMVLGTHGDLMVPLPRYTTVFGVPVTELLPADTLEKIVERTRKGGGEIVKLMGTSAWFAPGDAAGFMAEAVVSDARRVMPASVLLKGEFGVDGVFIGSPCVLGAGGVQRVMELVLTDEERAAFTTSAEHIRALQTEVDALFG